MDDDSEGLTPAEVWLDRWMGRLLWAVVIFVFLVTIVREGLTAHYDPFWSVVGIISLVTSVTVGIVVDRRAARRRSARSRERITEVRR